MPLFEHSAVPCADVGDVGMSACAARPAASGDADVSTGTRRPGTSAEHLEGSRPGARLRARPRARPLHAKEILVDRDVVGVAPALVALARLERATDLRGAANPSASATPRPTSPRRDGAAAKFRRDATAPRPDVRPLAPVVDGPRGGGDAAGLRAFPVAVAVVELLTCAGTDRSAAPTSNVAENADSMGRRAPRATTRRAKTFEGAAPFGSRPARRQPKHRAPSASQSTSSSQSRLPWPDTRATSAHAATSAAPRAEAPMRGLPQGFWCCDDDGR